MLFPLFRVILTYTEIIREIKFLWNDNGLLQFRYNNRIGIIEGKSEVKTALFKTLRGGPLHLDSDKATLP